MTAKDGRSPDSGWTRHCNESGSQKLSSELKPPLSPPKLESVENPPLSLSELPELPEPPNTPPNPPWSEPP